MNTFTKRAHCTKTSDTANECYTSNLLVATSLRKNAPKMIKAQSIQYISSYHTPASIHI